MKPDASDKDPAFNAMAMDILSNVLSRADNPGGMGTYLTEEVRELTGARCVLLIQYLGAPTVPAHRVVSVNPLRRRKWAESPAGNRLYEVVHRVQAAQLWRGEEPSEIAGLLQRDGFELSMVFPLFTGEFRVGAMLVLGLPDEEHITAELGLLNNLSTIVALVLRSAILFETQAQLIQERTAELRDKNEKLTMELTERKRAEKALKVSEERFRRLADNARDAIYRMSLPDGIYEYMSPAATELFGYAPEDFYASPQLIRDVIHPDWHGYFEEQWSRLLRGDMPPSYEYPIIHKSGEVRWVNQRNIMIRDDGGRIVAIEGIVTDITTRKRAEEEVRKLNQELEQRVIDRTAQLEAAINELEAFAYTVSHDLRAPLRHIDGFIELLHERTASTLDEQSRHYMAVTSDSAKRLGMLIDDLLSFVRMGRSEVSKIQVDLGALVQEVIREFESEAKDRNIHWDITGLPTVTGDRAMLRIVLVNLISNALKFTRPRQQVEIEIGWKPGDKGETVVFVRDNGVGFDMKYADKLFGVFQRLHHADEFEGTGIGLANVHRIISRHGGRTWAEGHVNQGATFYFSLPQPNQQGV